ncbi:outer membrane beta-barrel protein [Echinicola salinicaeni]|uniref:outer membrane beta-barrel protein n=1 Tax=Echinicola salinicaeni TaxID=2762757 RepID=UPI00164476E7|nr:outer membrane beta-barrel protein [Echinicola salinicaeni]
MEKYLFYFLLLFIPFNAFSQNHFIGLDGGLVFSNLSSKSFRNTDGKIGKKFGISYEYQAPNHILYGIDANYEQRGFKINSANGVQISYNFNYLSIPLKVGVYDKLSRFFINGNVGVIPSRLLKAFAEVPITNIPNSMESDINEITGFVRHFDIGALGEFQVGYYIFDVLLLRFQVNYQHSFTSVFGKQFFAEEKGYHRNLGAVLKATWKLNL